MELNPFMPFFFLAQKRRHHITAVIKHLLKIGSNQSQPPLCIYLCLYFALSRIFDRSKISIRSFTQKDGKYPYYYYYSAKVEKCQPMLRIGLFCCKKGLILIIAISRIMLLHFDECSKLFYIRK